MSNTRYGVIERKNLLRKTVRGLKKSATLVINEQCNALKAQGRDVFKLGLGQSPFPVPTSVVEALKEHAHEKDYLPVEGLFALRSAVAEHHTRMNGVSIMPEGVLVGPGSKELLFLLQLVFEGAIILPSPCWVSYRPQARILGHSIKTIKTRFENTWKISAKDLKDLSLLQANPYTPKLFILNYPSNPTGQIYSAQELEEISRVARKYNIIILSDEIYGRLTFNKTHTSIATYYPEGTIISSGLSKWCGAGGWRLGTFSFPNTLYALKEAMATIASETYTSVSAPIQHAAITAFKENSAIDAYVADSVRILHALGEWCALTLRNAGVRVHNPQGGFYVFCDFSELNDIIDKKGIFDDVELCESILNKTGVAILPGSDFERSPEELTARLAFVNFDGKRALDAVRNIPQKVPLTTDFLETYCGDTLKAVRRIVSWLSQEHERGA
ncbi:aspartate aminotransferase [archaeon CG10_big_fil_rev_8_21_14_0_10_43_11]|nr:MAG: aspartate aminotransferase [archaeon CG10_big_fil_rev_8_21_14_0_10_43_11]